MKEFKQLEEKLKNFGSKLSPEQCKELRDILDSFAQLHYKFGETYKMVLIDLIPSKVQTSLNNNLPIKDSVTGFKPPAKQTLADLTMTLARNLELQLKEKKE